MASITDGGWGSSGDNPLGSSSGLTRKRSSYGTDGGYSPAFLRYQAHHLAQAGDLQPRRGRTSAYAKGELAGMGPSEAQAHLQDSYENASDEDVQPFQSPVATLPHEAAQAQAASPTPTIAPNSPAAVNPHAPDASQGDYGANPDADLARLRTAGVIGANQTISDPTAFKAAVAKLDDKNSKAYAAAGSPSAVPPPSLTAPAPGRIGAVTGDMTTPISPTSAPAIVPAPQVSTMPPVATPVTPPVAPATTGATTGAIAGATAPLPPYAPASVGTINGQPGNQVVAALKTQNDASDVEAGRAAPVPVIGSGATDSSATANKYVGSDAPPPIPGASDDIDPITGKKKQTAIA